MRPLTTILSTISSHPKHDPYPYMAIPVYPFSENMPQVDHGIHLTSSQFHTTDTSIAPGTSNAPERDQIPPSGFPPADEIGLFPH